MSEKLYKDAKEVVSSVIEKVIGNIDGNPFKVNARWPDIVGSNLSTFCSFDKVVKKTLYINVFSRNYTTYVLMNKNLILRNFNSFYPDLKVTGVKVSCNND